MIRNSNRIANGKRTDDVSCQFACFSFENMKILRFIVSVVAVAIFNKGCTPSDRDDLSQKVDKKDEARLVYAERTGCYFDDIKQDEVLLKVNDKVLTKRDILENAEMTVALRKLRNKKLTPKNLRNLRLKLYLGYFNEFIRMTVISDYVRENGVMLKDETLEAFKRRAFLAVRSKKEKKFDDLFLVDGVDREKLVERVRFEATCANLKEHLRTLFPTNFTEKYVSNELARVKRYNAAMAQTNILVYARATNAWEELRAGADFVTVGKKYTEIDLERNDNCEWGVLDEVFLKDDTTLLSILRNMTPGEYTVPVECDNGLAIVRLDERLDSGDYRLSRIFFHLPLFEQVPDRKMILDCAYENYYNKKYQRLIEELIKSAKIEYPLGKKIFNRRK